MNDTAAIIKDLILEAVPGLSFDPAADGDKPLAQIGLDSLDKMSVLLAVQERWGIEFSAEEINEMGTFNAICRRVG